MGGLIIWLSIWGFLSFLISRKSKSVIITIGGGLVVSLLILSVFYGVKGAFFKSPETVEACKIAKEFTDDEMSAIAMYDEKTLVVSGVAGSKGDSVNGLFLQFPCGKFWPAVQCFFQRSKASDLAKISSGQNVSIKGTCKGKILGVLIFDKCTIVPN